MIDTAQIHEELLREQAYLVARGVRPLAIAGRCPADPLEMLRAATQVEALACEGAIPFVHDDADGYATYGYAAAGWILDLYHWLTVEGEVPSAHEHQVVGLLLGYSPEAIARHQQAGSGRRFIEPG